MQIDQILRGLCLSGADVCELSARELLIGSSFTRTYKEVLFRFLIANRCSILLVVYLGHIQFLFTGFVSRIRYGGSFLWQFTLTKSVLRIVSCLL